MTTPCPGDTSEEARLCLASVVLAHMFSLLWLHSEAHSAERPGCTCEPLSFCVLARFLHYKGRGAGEESVQAGFDAALHLRRKLAELQLSRCAEAFLEYHFNSYFVKKCSRWPFSWALTEESCTKQWLLKLICLIWWKLQSLPTCSRPKISPGPFSERKRWQA